MTSPLSQDQKGKSLGRLDDEDLLSRVYPSCRSMVDGDTWAWILATCAQDAGPESFPTTVSLQQGDARVPGFLAELARLEWILYKLSTEQDDIPRQTEEIVVNPTLQLLQLAWKHLPFLLKGKKRLTPKEPEPGEEYVLVWRDPETRKVKTQVATDEDLLVLKVVVEGIDPEKVAAAAALPVGAVDAAIRRGAAKGLLIAPRSHIRRDPASFPAAEHQYERFVSSSYFTLQWHVTQACDLHCKHCYDRSKRSPLTPAQGLEILDDLRAFCRDKNVRGQVSFTGGNPLLYPHFSDLYKAASERDLAVAILGNPAPREQLEALLAIQRPVFFQVSLEGLEEHNNMIRGPGHFQRVMKFLKLLRDLGISSKVMLTLTKGNMDQVLPLAEILRDSTDDFTFNRLSMVGEGANLQPPSRENFAEFLKTYMKASEHNPIMGWKDNVINIVCHENGLEPFGGCTGYGCGAAFNFMALLSDGEVHACRKFPSLIGNAFKESLTDIYDSEEARQYRSGPRSCQGCPIRLVCRGCLAVAYSHGLDVFEDRDPYCFMAFS
ncbi:MAG: selenobiotic family peptide radical SAM maturase [Deltaproteobacteria bacterium]|nr:selenobiotic family peptide radical SAM maturase [Deltaproteobacteria bacterium]